MEKSYSNYGSTNFTDTRIDFGIVEGNEIEERMTSLPLIISTLGNELKKIRSTLGFRTYAFIDEYPKASLGITALMGTAFGFVVFPLTPFFNSALPIITDQHLVGLTMSVGGSSLASIWGWGITRQITYCKYGSLERTLSVAFETLSQDEAYNQFIEALRNYYQNPCEQKIPDLFQQFGLIQFDRWTLPKNPYLLGMNKEDVEGALRCFLLRDVHLVLAKDLEEFETPILSETPKKLYKILKNENNNKNQDLFEFFENEKNIQDLFEFLKCEIPSKKGMAYFVENYSAMLPFLPFGC